ncbi:TonB-dependent receptor domain-containing protein [Polyangium aurulentum]|uniref:TonB-dependent receptor domain-containing protein n=1 Tax=Polyangium aurulentum TaxID=2567896 RepID=UPI0010ADFB74|nr:TonB-dependent receptor [Polyangium aurulentum]UQA57657.1 TonB-dependent receptor [Polyangium aurulentum]
MLATVALAPASVARADGVADEAELHFQLGAGAYQRGEYTAALEHFMLSNRLAPNRRVVFNIARAFEQLRQYPDAYRYYVDALAGETDAVAIEGAKAAIARLQPNVAVLEVVTDPPGAMVFIDRKDLGSRGRAPRPLAVQPGSYRIIAELEGYEPAASEPVEAKLGASTRVSLSLVRIVGKVKVSVTGAPRAAVRVDDEGGPIACTAPCELSLSPGKHDLFFSGDGIWAPPRRVNVVAKRSSEVTVALRALTGSVLVHTEETGALVTVDDRPAGFTPTVLREVPAGRRKIRVSLRGHAPVERTITVKQGEEVDAGTFELVPLREVTAVSRYAERIDDAPSSVTILDGRELRAFGHPTIVESLRGVRGMSLSNDRAYASVAVRALGQPNDYGNRVLVLADGQALNDNILNSSYIGSDGRADLWDVERIEVVRGPGSLLYGAGAFSGVINMVTRSREEPSGVHVGVGSYDNAVLRGRGGFHLHFGKDRGVWASGWGAQSQGFDLEVPAVDGPSPRVVRGVEAFSSGGTAGRAYWGPATLQWLFHRRAQSTPTGAYQTELGNRRTTFGDTRMMLEARFEPQLSRSFQLLVRAHANHYTFDGLYAFEGGEDNVERFSGTWFGGEARLVYSPGPRLRVTVGGEAQWHPEATLLGHEVVNGVRAEDPYLHAERPYQFGAGYALGEWEPVKWLRLSGGVRVDVYSTFGAVFVPRGAVIVKPAPGGTLKLMGGRAFRAPSIYEQLYNDDGKSQVEALRGLKAEKIYSGEIEYTQRFLDDWAALVAAHGSYIEDLIETTPVVPPLVPGVDVVRYDNQGTPVLVVGADAEIRREWRRGWMLSAMYGYQRAQYLDDALENPRVPTVPEHLASFKGVVPIVPDLVSAGLRMTLEAPRLLTTGESTPANLVADVTVSGEIRQYGLRYVVGVYNVGDRRYETAVTDTFRTRTMPQNGRTFLIDIVGTYP